MVSFQCDGCADTVKKPKLDQHRQRCWAPFTCLDCSTTFQNQDYKKHTSCITEAEKYQGALYKGPRKGQQAQQSATSSPAPAAAAAAATPSAEASTSDSSAPAIHPSRMQQVDSQNSGFNSGNSYNNFNRGGPSSRGFGGRGRGGFQSGPSRPFGSKYAATGENKSTPEGGMRSWGSTPVNGTPVPETAAAPAPTPAAPAPVAQASSSSTPAPATQEKKKNKKKGDKGGTGSKANSKHPKSDEATSTLAPTATTTTTTATASEEPSKKRKRSNSPAPALSAQNSSSVSTELSEKTLKKIRKHASRLAEKSAPSSAVSLAEFLKSVGEGKKETVGTADVERAAKVSFQDGKWVLSF